MVSCASSAVMEVMSMLPEVGGCEILQAQLDLMFRPRVEVKLEVVAVLLMRLSIEADH